MRILLVRHGETLGNATRVFQVPEMPLSERGVAQAERLARRLSRRAIGGVLSSDLRRAHMTAEAVVAATGAPLTLDPRLQERSFGDLRGTPYAELEVDPFAPGYVPPGGESWDELHARVDAAWAGVVQATRETRRGDLVVVTHGLVCHSLLSRRLRLRPGLDPPIGFANTSVTIIGAEPPWEVERVNCTAHLAADTETDTELDGGLIA